MPTSNSPTFTGAVDTGTLVVGTQHIVNNYYGDGERTDPTRLQAQIRSYLKWVAEEYGRIVLRGIKRDDAQVIELDLDAVYVPLEATLGPQRRDDERVRPDSKFRRTGSIDRDSEFAVRAEVVEIGLNQVASLGNRVIIVGGPGSGKTTVLLHTAWALATALLDPSSDVASSRLGLIAPLPLPIFVPLSAFNAYRRKSATGPESGTLSAFISNHLIANEAAVSLPHNFFSRLLEAGRDVMLLLDGLDEVANAREREEVRQAVEKLVSGKDELCTLVTCRTAAYASPGTPLGQSFRQVNVRPLDFVKHVTPMVRRIEARLYKDRPAEAETRATRLLDRISELEADRADDPLADSPLMVRILAIIDFAGQKLPDERAQLFERAVDSLVLMDYAPDPKAVQPLADLQAGHYALLQYLAFHMHSKGRDQGREIDEEALRRALAGRPGLDDLIENTQSRGSLLEYRGGTFQFSHLAFQEFLTARHLREVVAMRDGLKGLVFFLGDGKLRDPWWREPILLLIGYTGARAAEVLPEFLDELIASGSNPTERMAALELASVGAAESRAAGSELRRKLAGRIAACYASRRQMSRIEPNVRAAAGRAMARLGDPRDEALRVDAMQLCRVPAGRFYMGALSFESSFLYVERPPSPASALASDYLIGKYQVTNAQYAEFAREGYGQEQWWTVARSAGAYANGEVIRQVLRWVRTSSELHIDGRTTWHIDEERSHGPVDFGAPFDVGNHPIVGVSWYEALAFCEWLQDRWHRAGWLREDQRVRLPSEPEWEKSARGGYWVPIRPRVCSARDLPGEESRLLPMVPSLSPLRRFAHGFRASPTRANTAETHLAATSPTGCFLNGASPYGCQDMSGNVMEWTRSAYGPWTIAGGEFDVMMKYRYPYRTDDGRERQEEDPNMARVQRGGSFDRYDWDARCSNRDAGPPCDRHNNVGFRVVVSPAFSSL